MNRSEELQSLSKNEVEDEKLALQKALLYFENVHGRPVTKDEKGQLKRPFDASIVASDNVSVRLSVVGNAQISEKQ